MSRLRPYLIILYLLACVILLALGDGLFDKGLKLLGHPIQAFSLVVCIAGPVLFGVSLRKLTWWVIALACWHIVAFDYSYNLINGLPWNFVGGTSIWDLFVAKQLPSGVIWGRVIFLLLGTFIPIRELKK